MNVIVYIISWMSLFVIVCMIQIALGWVLIPAVMFMHRVISTSHILRVWIQRSAGLMCRVSLSWVVSISWVNCWAISGSHFLFSLSEQCLIIFTEIIIITINWYHWRIKRPKVVVHVHLFDLLLLHAALTLLAQNVAKGSWILLV